ncbi:unnamed protein product [Symbiodinium sp. CCMP2592]|nr:unnamed protein product [Symbiodinium sp. CCMP2592]
MATAQAVVLKKLPRRVCPSPSLPRFLASLRSWGGAGAICGGQFFDCDFFLCTLAILRVLDVVPLCFGSFVVDFVELTGIIFFLVEGLLIEVPVWGGQFFSFVYLILPFALHIGIGNMESAVVNVDQHMEGEEKPSPTEIAESGNEMDEDVKEEMPAAPVKKKEKRKRERRAKPVCVRRGDRTKGSTDPPSISDHDDDDEDDDEDIGSPAKRPHEDSGAINAAEIRELLFGHVKEMKQAWRSFQGRLDKVETVQTQQQHEMVNLRTRTHKLEKDTESMRQMNDQTNRNVDHLTEEVKNMKVQWEEIKLSAWPAANAVMPRDAKDPKNSAMTSDPWSEYLRGKGRNLGRHGDTEDHRAAAASSADGGGQRDKNPDALTEDEKRTLVVGGWLRDTRRAVIEEESAALFATENIKNLLDSTKLMIYGPRRSVGMLKFQQREGESYEQMKHRMWETVKLVAAAKYSLPSTKEGGDVRTLWASFVKTKSARSKSALVSMVRRVTIALALDARDEQGSCVHVLNTQTTAYDCDWGLGTIWCGVHKLASATHKAPKEGEHVLVSGGWVSTTAIAQTAGCSVDEAKQALEREL